MRILFVASEVAPWSKTGGLGDVAGALPRALAKRGHAVTVVSPRYGWIDPIQQGFERSGDLWIGESTGVRWVFLEQPKYFARPKPYGDATGDYPDNDLRFGFLSSGALEAARVLQFTPEVIHANDWQTGLAPLLAKGMARTVFTIHNLAYQGRFPPAALKRLGLSDALFAPEAMEFWGEVSLLKAGIVFADALTTVSPRYAEEICADDAVGCGFSGLLGARASDLHGILNGVDYTEWNPAADPHLPASFGPDDLVGKAHCKAELRTEMKLEANRPEAPLFGCVGRLVHQKGSDLTAAAAPALVERGAQIALLGSGEPALETAWRDLAARFPGRIAVQIGFDEGLAHRIEAGSDLFLMPSRFEPCGLNQMYSLRYGTLPIVHAVGGLANTVEDEVTGFTFTEATVEALVAAADRALAMYGNSDRFEACQRQAMARDFSWDRAAAAYERIYTGT